MHEMNKDSDKTLVVCLGASAGGLEALEAFFSAVKPDTGASFVVIVHLARDFKSALPELLARRTTLPVTAAEDGQVIFPNHVYIIPPGVNMVVRDGRTFFKDQPRRHGANMPIDIFLESMVGDAGRHSAAIILSGTGSDGTRGLRKVKEAGGLILVQDPDTSHFDGMPRSALSVGVPDAVDRPEVLAKRVAAYARLLRDGPVIEEEAIAAELDSIVEVIQGRGYPNFSRYRKSMVQRRIQRRMTLAGIADVGAYVSNLRENQGEIQHLRDDLLIGVTGFFRDASAYEVLQREFFGAYVSRHDPGEPVRIWIPACSTGQEAYSIAMLCAEFNATHEARKFNIFATDIHKSALDFASAGVYSQSDVSDVPASMYTKYFTEDQHLHVSRNIREKVIFAQHDLLSDPPFTKIHLVCCRNFLIYMEPQTQEQVLASLHFSLINKGMLFLGSSETVSPLDDALEPVNMAARLYRKTRDFVHPAMRRRNGSADPVAIVPRTVRNPLVPEPQDEIARLVLERVFDSDQSSCALLDGDGKILEVFNDALGLFKLRKGRPTSDMRQIAPREVSFALTTGMHLLRQSHEPVEYAVMIDSVEPAMRVNIQMLGLNQQGDDTDKLVFMVRRLDVDRDYQFPQQPDIDGAEAENIFKLESELRDTRETLQATIEELQVTNEELQGANEELVAANEELQSTNEELQSVNEELHTVNVELQRKNHDLSVLTADLDNLLENIEIGTLFLDSELNIRKFTGGVADLISLTPHDIGRSIENFNCALSTDFLEDVRNVINNGQRLEKQVSAPGGAWYLMRVVPYQTNLGSDDGVIVTFVDVTGTKNMEELARSINQQLEDANNRLLDQASELEDLFSITAHDLKRPVSSIGGLLQLVLKRAGEELPNKLREHVESALSECQRMDRMIRDLGQVSGASHAEPVEEEVDLQAWMDGIMDSFSAEAKARHIRLNYSCDRAIIYLNRTAPEQALRNVVENAILYGSSAEQPRIDVTCQLIKSSLVISVTDNGKGIAPEHKERIFELFRRLEPDVGDGAGVGLVAARRMLAKVRGSVSVASEVGGGAKFTITVPIDTRGAEKRAAVQRILIVEDDPVDAKTAMRHLGDQYETHWAKTLEESKSMVKEEVYDLVLLDLSLPDGHGLELLTEVRKNLHQEVPIVILTGHSGVVEEGVLRASTAGYLTKAAAQQQSLLRATVVEAIASQGKPSETLH